MSPRRCAWCLASFLFTLAAVAGDPSPAAAQKKDPDPKKKPGAGGFAEAGAIKRSDKAFSYDFAVSPDGKKVAMMVGSPLDLEFGIIDVETGKLDKSWKFGTAVNQTAWAADGASLVGVVQGEAMVGGKKTRVTVWDAKGWEEKAAFEFADFPGSLAVSADGKLVAVASGSAGSLGGVAKVWDVGAKKEVFTTPAAVGTPRVGISADGKVLAVSGVGSTKDAIGLFDLPSGKARGSFKARPEFALSADGKTVAEWVYGNDGLVINVWGLGAKAPRVIKGGKWKPDSVVFADKDRHLIVPGGLAQDEVRVYDLKTLALADTVTVGKQTPGRNYLQVKFTPDSAQMFTYGTDRTVRYWTTPFGDKKAPRP